MSPMQRPARVQLPLATITDVFYLAVCAYCGTPDEGVTIPFGDPAARDEWVDAHRAGTRHPVARRMEVRGWVDP